MQKMLGRFGSECVEFMGPYHPSVQVCLDWRGAGTYKLVFWKTPGYTHRIERTCIAHSRAALLIQVRKLMKKHNWDRYVGCQRYPARDMGLL